MTDHEPSEVEKQLFSIFSRHLHTEVESVEVDLLELGILDSLKFVELLLALETELDIKLSVQELELDNFRSIRRIAAFLTEAGKKNYVVAS